MLLPPPFTLEKLRLKSRHWLAGLLSGSSEEASASELIKVIGKILSLVVLGLRPHSLLSVIPGPLLEAAYTPIHVIPSSFKPKIVF